MTKIGAMTNHPPFDALTTSSSTADRNGFVSGQSLAKPDGWSTGADAYRGFIV